MISTTVSAMFCRIILRSPVGSSEFRVSSFELDCRLSEANLHRGRPGRTRNAKFETQIYESESLRHPKAQRARSTG